MSSVPLESIRALSQKITNDFLQEQTEMVRNVDKLVIILHPQTAKKTYRDEEKEADQFQSNTKSSRERREDLYKATVLKSMREKKEMQKIFIYFLAQQKEFLALETRREQLREELARKRQKELSYSLDEKAKHKLEKLLQEMEKLISSIEKLMDLLLKAISQLQSAIIHNNIEFIANFEIIARTGLEKLAEQTGGEFYLTVGDIKLKVDFDKILEIFTNANEKAFYEITHGKTVEIATVRAEAETEVQKYLIAFDKSVDTQCLTPDAIKQATTEVMAVWDQQANLLAKHIAVTTEMQNDIDTYKAKFVEFESTKQHVEEIEEDMGLLDVSPEDVDKAEECIDEIQSIIDAVNVNLVSRIGSKLTALDNSVLMAQSKLNSACTKDFALVENDQLNIKPTGGNFS